MPRPTRYDRPTVRMTIYVHPDTAALIAGWTAGAANRSPGMWVDDIARRTLGSPTPPEAFCAPAEPAYDLPTRTGRPLKDEGWTVRSLKAEGWTVDERTGDFIPPAGMDPLQAERRWQEEIARRQEYAARSPSPAKPHKRAVINGGVVICEVCRVPTSRWADSCPGAS